jgi:translation initiation factor eIF-2B subunit delta
VIARVGVEKINEDDVILTFSYSASVLSILLLARKNAIPFRVILVDPRVGDGGACSRMAKELLGCGVKVTYVGMEGVSYVMRDVDKIMLGAEGVMSNGSVFARVGTLGVAQVASAYRKPVLVCCEGYKFTNKVQLDSITHNELGSTDGMGTKEDNDGADYLNLLYDLTPSELVGGVVTETGLLPGSSVAVLLREME